VFTQPATFLHEAELATYCQLDFPERRQSYLAGRYIAKKVLSAYLLEEDLRQIRIDAGVFGQPVVVHASGQSPAVSISHSHGSAVALAFHEGHPMGIDLERVTSGAKAAVDSQITAREKRLYRPGEEEEAIFYTRLWTVKEALSKVLRTGLMMPFWVLEVASIGQAGGWTESTFRHLAQYKALSFLWENHICSIVLPRNSSCEPRDWLPGNG